MSSREQEAETASDAPEAQHAPRSLAAGGALEVPQALEADECRRVTREEHGNP